MKFFFATGLFLITVSIVSAQTRIGIRAGANNSTAKVFDATGKLKNHYVYGVNAGVFIDVPFEGALHFSPSINYSKRGYAYTYPSGPLLRTDIRVHYIDIIPALSLNFPIRESIENTAIIEFGPVFSTAISGKEKNTLVNSSVVTNKLVFNYQNYSRFDVGVSGSLGIALKKISLKTAYYFGLANVENDESLKRNIQTRMFSITVGYYIK